MEILGDTNILLRHSRLDLDTAKVARRAVRRLKSQKHTLHAAAQNYVELWNVATRPASKNGLGLSPAEAEELVRRLTRNFPIIPDSPLVFPEWRRIVKKYGVSGVNVHDARLVAVMKVQGISHILTFNGADFARYAPEGIVAVDPEGV